MTNDNRQPTTGNHDWKKDFHLWLPLACISWWLAWKYRDEFISDWDGFDYTSYTVQHLPSALGLGRTLFLGCNYLLWEITHRYFSLPPEQAHLALQYGVMAQAGPAIIGIYALCKELTASRPAAMFGATIVAASPYFIIYSGRGMSEIPGFLMLSWSLWWMLRCLRRGRSIGFLLAAALVGLSANVREFAIFYFPFIPIAARLYGLKWRFALAAFALATISAFMGMAFWAWYDTNNYLRSVMNWYTLSARERKAHPVTINNLWFAADFAFNCSAAVALQTPVALIQLYAKRKMHTLLWLGALGLFANTVLIANHDLSVNPRYLLTGLLGLAAICGWSLAELIKNYGVRAAAVLLGLIVLTKGTYNHMAKELYGQQWSARAAKNYITKIEKLPWNSGFIVGSRTPLIHFLSGVGAKPYWRTISPGAGWPAGKLDEAIQEFFYAGRLVYVDFDPELWQPGVRKASQEIDDLKMIKRNYKLEHLRDSFYRIVERLPERTDTNTVGITRCRYWQLKSPGKLENPSISSAARGNNILLTSQIKLCKINLRCYDAR